MERQQYVHPIEQLSSVVDSSDVLTLQTAVRKVYIDDLVKEYIASLVEATRHHHSIYLGASPRGSLALFRTAQAHALMQGRDYVLPDDVKALAEPVLAHRLIVHPTEQSQDKSGRSTIIKLLETVPVPGTLATR